MLNSSYTNYTLCRSTFPICKTAIQSLLTASPRVLRESKICKALYSFKGLCLTQQMWYFYEPSRGTFLWWITQLKLCSLGEKRCLSRNTWFDSRLLASVAKTTKKIHFRIVTCIKGGRTTRLVEIKIFMIAKFIERDKGNLLRDTAENF